MTEFEAIYRRYSKDVFRFALYLSDDSMLAEDLAAEAFVRLWTAAAICCFFCYGPGTT